LEDKIEEIEKLNIIMIKYISALKVLETQLDIISDDFKYIKDYNPIEHIKTRIKSADSIIDKLERKNIDFTIENVEEHLFDIVGARIVCSFESDVFDLVNIIKKSSIIKVIDEKDYINNPKPSGYRSYHLLVEIPVELINGKYNIKAEIQIRTMAMDLWASLEHKIKYKSKDIITNDISDTLIDASEMLYNLDSTMDNIVNRKVSLIEQE
jgi:putative GTP pyrophosphokinase